MKKGFLLLSLFGAFAYVTLSSNGSGYTSENRTGSNGGTVGCGGSSCHNTSATVTMPTVILLDSAGTGHFVTRYKAGASYVIRMIASNATGPKFGFQLSTVKGTGSSSSQAGTFVSIPTGMAINTIGGRTILGHTMPLDSVNRLGMGIDSVNVNWTAPATSGSGTITMYGVINNVNGDGTNSSADKWNSGSASFTEILSTDVETVANTLSTVAYPNPVLNNLNIRVNESKSGNYHVVILNLNGKVALNTTVVSTNGVLSLDMSNLTTGMYVVSIDKDGVSSKHTIVKQ